jgi:hypothetical protein
MATSSCLPSVLIFQLGSINNHAAQSRILTLIIVARTVFWATHNACWAETCTWSGGTGHWEDNTWAFTGEDQPPQPLDNDAVIILSGRPMIIFFEGMATLNVALGSGIDNGGAMNVSGSVTNAGQIVGITNGQRGILTGFLGGGGEVVLADSIGKNAVLAGADTGQFIIPITHAVDYTIRAEETSGDSMATLAISGTMTNNCVIRSSATGMISLESATLTMGATGQLIADGQPIQLDGAATIYGGSIDAINGAKFVRRPDLRGSTVFSGGTINGDFDLDGDVDGNDFLAWQRSGSPIENSTGDLALCRAHFEAPAVAVATAVSEPTSAILAGMVRQTPSAY